MRILQRNYGLLTVIMIAIFTFNPLIANAKDEVKISPELRAKIKKAKIYRADLIEDQIRREIREEGLHERNDRLRKEARERRERLRERKYND